MSGRTAFFVTAIFVLTRVSSVFAWNGEAHQLIGWIAEERLTDSAKAGVKELLGNANLSDAEIVGWADVVRRERRETAPWHYVNIPIEAEGYDPQRDGNDGNNIIDAIERFTKVLADRTAPKEDRVEALKFLVHFMGDLHQPLHCAERNADKGGNGRLVFFPGRKSAVSLHSVWDALILPRSRGKGSVAQYGNVLNARVTEKDAKRWATGTAQDWATESWQMTKEVAYASVPVEGPPPTLTKDYVERAQLAVDERIQTAGVRLATVLNSVFDVKR